MSHYRCEVIIPPARSEDVEAAIAEILKPFDEDPPGYPKPPTSTKLPRSTSDGWRPSTPHRRLRTTGPIER